MIGRGCMIGGDAAAGKGIQIIGVPIIGERKADITDGLIHRWPLTSNANDIVGALNMTNNGSVTFSANGASFNGSSQWLSCTKTRPTQFTMTSWITPVNFSARRCAFAASDDTGTNGWGWCAYPTNENANVVVTEGSINIPNELTLTHYPSNTKTLSVVTYGSGSLKAYRNSMLIAETTVNGSGTSSNSLSVGRFGAYDYAYWYGTIADVRLYNRALTSFEIEVLADNGPNP